MGRWIVRQGETEGYLPRKRIERNVERARQLRDQLSLPEVLLWRLLKGSPNGVHIRSQHPIGRYILDFYCAKSKTAFEIDGIVDEMGDRPERDADRDAWLRDQGIEVVRITAGEVLKSPEDVAERIVRFCQRLYPSVWTCGPSTSPFVAFAKNGKDRDPKTPPHFHEVEMGRWRARSA